MLTHHLLHRGMQNFHTCAAAIRIVVLQCFRTGVGQRLIFSTNGACNQEKFEHFCLTE